MSDSAAPHLVDLRDLRLDTAHALVSQVNGSGPATASDYAHPRQYLQGLIDGLCELSLKDPLTGLANRRHFRAVLEREIDRVTRSGEAALLLMLARGGCLHVSGLKLPVETALRKAGVLPAAAGLVTYRTDAEALVALQQLPSGS